LPSALAAFRLPAPPTGERLHEAVRASLRILDLTDSSRIVPVYAAIYRAVLGESDFSVHLAGQTGTFKTSIAALAMQHFGNKFDPRHLPAAWSGTANANAELQFILKDAPLLIDDFVPRGSRADIDRLHRDADRIFRGQGNNAGRGRMARDTSLREPKPPRGLTLSTGEEIPHGESLRSRIWISEFSPGDVNREILTECQQDAGAGLYAEAMSGYLQWLAARYPKLGKWLRKSVVLYSKKATQDGQHARTPEINCQPDGWVPALFGVCQNRGRNFRTGIDAPPDRGLELPRPRFGRSNARFGRGRTSAAVPGPDCLCNRAW